MFLIVLPLPTLKGRLFPWYPDLPFEQILLIISHNRGYTKTKMASIISMFVLVAFQLSIQAAKSEPLIQDEAWGYVEVRPNAHMFWWFYGAQVKDPAERVQKPLLMWLQGGPGASSTGYGNFAEIGPLDIDLKPRSTTWIKEANIVFVDNPVGCGYSYVTDPSALTTNISGT